MNIPNILSIFRMSLVPVFVVFFFSKGNNAMLYAAGIYALAGLTDVLDGIIARKFNLITKLGKILDPLADKMMTITVFVCITIRGLLPWWLILLIFAKDVLLIIGGAKLYRELSYVFAANWIGKATTVLLVSGGILLMLFENIIPSLAKTIFMIAAVIMTFTAFGSYLCQYLNFKKKQNTSKL